MAAWAVNSTSEEFERHGQTIIDYVKEETGMDVQLTDLRPEFLSAFHACNEGMRESLLRFFARNMNDLIDEAAKHA